MAKRIDVRSLDIYYGGFHAVQDVSMTVEPRTVTAFIGPSGCGKSTLLRTLNRMHEVIPGAHVKGSVQLDGTELYDQGVDPVAASCCRHGVPATQPVPVNVDLRQRCLGPTAERREEQKDLDRGRGTLTDLGEPVERGQRPTRQGRHWPFRRTATATLHCSRHRRRAPGAADGRAMLGTRPDLHACHRGPDR